jgi:hypothetical protein
MNFKTAIEVLTGEKFEHGWDKNYVVYGQALMNLEFQQVHVVDWWYLDASMLYVLSPFAENEVNINLLMNHPIYKDQPFGVSLIGKEWFMVDSVPLANLHKDALATIACRVAYAANSLAREFTKSEEERQRFLGNVIQFG